MCFIDDVMIFYWVDIDSIKIMRRVLDDFAGLSRLLTNPEKSHVFLSEADDELETSLHTLLGFRRGSLPIRYIGVQLISTRLTH